MLSDNKSVYGGGGMPPQTAQNRPESTKTQKLGVISSGNKTANITLEDLGITEAEFKETIKPKTKREKDLEYIEPLKEIQKIVPDNSKYIGDDGKLALPEEIISFVGNRCYLNKYLFLAKHLGVGFLMRVYKIALTKNKPRCWFGAVLSKENLARTIRDTKKYFEDLEKVVRMGAKYGIEITRKYINFVMFGYWYLGAYKFEDIMRFCSGADNPSNAFGSQLRKNIWSWLLDYRKLQTQA